VFLEGAAVTPEKNAAAAFPIIAPCKGRKVKEMRRGEGWRLEVGMDVKQA
jgi:hypothetical protein